MSDCFSSSSPSEEAHSKCEDAVYNAVMSQLDEEAANPTLVEAIPTIGKTTAAAKFAAEVVEGDSKFKVTYLTHRISNRDQFEEKVREFVSDEGSINPVRLPVLEDDCPTAMGDHGKGWENRLIELRNQGISPSTLHKNTQFSLPCGDTECPYMDWWSKNEKENLIIGHLSHAYAPQVIEDRVIIVDEDPGDAYQTRFSAGELHDLVRAFLSRIKEPPVTDLDGLKQLKQGRGPLEQAREQVYEYAVDTDYFELGKQILKERQGHIQAANAVRAVLEPVVDNPKNEESYRVKLQNGVEHTRLGDNTVAAYNPRTGQLAIRRTPDFSVAEALVALDGTPTKDLWKGRLGVEELDHVQVLSDECRREYLDRVLGYTLYQTSNYVKPYSGASRERISFDKDRGLLHEVQRQFEGEIGLITTKNARLKLLNQDDENDVEIADGYLNHYGNIKGSNQFEGDEVKVGVVIGSPHPGSNELKLVAGLNGDSYEAHAVEVKNGNHQYTRREPSDDSRHYLNHFRENRVAQAVLRFGREDGATVFIHTSAVPKWMKPLVQELAGKRRSTGEQEVIDAIQGLDEATTGEITERTEVTINTVRNHLKSLATEGLVMEIGTSHRNIWKMNGEIGDISPTYNIEIPN